MEEKIALIATRLGKIEKRLELMDERDSAHTKELLTRSEGMNMLGCSSTTFDDYVARQLFPVYKIGRKVYVKRSEVMAFIESNVMRQEVAA